MTDEVHEPMTTEQKAAAWEMLAGMMVMLQTRLDLGSPRNYMTVSLEGVLAPFDRAQLTFIRPGGKSPHEVAEDMKALLRQCLDVVDDLAEHNSIDEVQKTSLKTFVRDQRARIPPGGPS